MNRIIALLLFMVMQVLLLIQWSAVAYYQVNRDFIAKNLCVNRDKPMLNCNGQCYLSKQLKASEEKEQKSNAERLNKMPEVVLGFQSISSLFKARYFERYVLENNFQISEIHPNFSTKGFFHPPQV